MNRRQLQRLFVTGLLTLIPIGLTWFVIKFVFQALSMLSSPLIQAVFKPLAAQSPQWFGWLASPSTQFIFGVLLTVESV
jgi:uncharacterized membrane protein